MSKKFDKPFCELVRFGNSIIATSGDCCDVGGFVWETDDEVCPSGDAECACTQDEDKNCVEY